jgi:hypothetical protein
VLSPAEKGAPKFRDLGPERGIRKIVHFLADNPAPRESQQLAGADAGIQVIAVVVSDENGNGRVIDDSAEEELKFSWTVFQEPAGSGCL